MDLFVIIPILFFSIVLHEFAHGYVAYRLGDDTAYVLGRLTLNPLKHIDLIGTFLVPALCIISGLPVFGWAKPVPVNARRLASPFKDMGKVALAGPTANLLLAIICAFLIKLIIVSGIFSADTAERSVQCLIYGIQINVLLAVFNLMPIPPLDGGHIVAALLPLKAAIKYTMFFGRFGMWLVIGLIVTGVFKYILYPPMYAVMSVISKFLAL
ncbi:MAG: site-2 protease family protein [Elusimicrobiaceae bacterium]|nr:site-2 protease family protein [Elusimicrobiaceae bacterium]